MNFKVAEALEKQTSFGGAIRKPKRKADKLKPKIEEALQAQGSKRKYHDATHRFLMENLSGRGGGFDSPQVRQRMHQLTSDFHPKVWEGYHNGKGSPTFELPADQPGKPITAQRRDTNAHVIMTGGSMRALTHSVNGLLSSFDSTFYSHYHV